MYKSAFILILCIILLSSCKKSCYTCFAGPFFYVPFKYDSSFNIVYDTVSHHNDTLLVKIDTIKRVNNAIIHDVCPGNAYYPEQSGYNYSGWTCFIDQ